MPLIVRIIQTVVVLVSLASWAAVGFFLWLPLLVRMIAFYVGAVALSLYKPDVDLPAAREKLNHAVEFYASGFQRTYAILSSAASEAPRPIVQPTGMKLERLLEFVFLDLGWTIAFWVLSTMVWWIKWIDFHGILSGFRS